MDITESKKSTTPLQCFFCKEKESKYCCPRCNEQYCSLECYRSEQHLQCSESFYRECVTQEMAGYHADDDSKKKMIDILSKLHNNDLNEGHPEIEGDNEDVEDLDSDDEQYVNLHDRLGDINLDDPAAVWNALTEDERNEFEALVSGGEVGKLVPQWLPWWGYHKESKLVEELKPDTQEEEALKLCPQIKDIPELSSMSKTEPADCVKYNIINVLASYAFLMRYFNGEPNSTEFVAYLLSICGSLGKNTNYNDEETAVRSVEQECVNSSIIDTDETSLQIMKHDVYLLLKGPSKENRLHYCYSALSHIHALFTEVKRSEKKKSKLEKIKVQNEFTKKFPSHGEQHLPEISLSQIKNNLMKIEYYLAYLKSYGLPSVIS